jgi:hypothetical protein
VRVDERQDAGAAGFDTDQTATRIVGVGGDAVARDGGCSCRCRTPPEVMVSPYASDVVVTPPVAVPGHCTTYRRW